LLQLFVHCSEEELEEKGAIIDVNFIIVILRASLAVGDDLDDPKASRRKHKKPPSPATRSPLRTPTPLPPSPAPTATSKLDAKAPVFVPARQQPASDKDLLKARALASDESTGSTPSRSSSPDMDNLVAEYVRIKMQITDLTARGKQAAHYDPALVLRLQERLMAVKSHYFFDERDAETQYRSERAKTDALLLQSRLRGSNPKLPVTPEKKLLKPSRVDLKLEAQDVPITSNIVDIFDQHEEGLGGMLEILDTLPSEVAGEQGTTIRVRDMVLPKHWSSKTPKTLLAELVFKVDRYAAVTYGIVSGQSRAKRASVMVNWEGRKTDEWAMLDVACHTEAQAEFYVATLALHALTFPTTDGFAAGSSGAFANQTSFRLLPPVFRDLWDELEVERKLREDLINRHVWANVRNIVEQKIDARSAVNIFRNTCSSH
jgi:ATP-dependent RNA helicase DHX29